MQVHHDHLGRELPYQPDGVGAGSRLSGYLDASFLQQVPQARPEEVVVVDEQDPDLAGSFVALDDGFANGSPLSGGAEESTSEG